MTIALIIIALAFIWLGYETEWLTVRLLVGSGQVDYPSSPYSFGRWLKEFDFHFANPFIGQPDYSQVPQPKLGFVFTALNCRNSWSDRYTIELSAGVENNKEPVLCGKKWLNKHWNDLVDYKPQIEISAYGVTHKMTLKSADTKLLRDIAKATMKVSRIEKKRYALA